MEIRKRNRVMNFQVRNAIALLILSSQSHNNASAFAFTRPTTSLSKPSLHHLHDSKYTLTALHATPPAHKSNKEKLHLLTFDLDDTIFPIGPVVADANVAQLRTLLNFGYDTAANEEIVAFSKQIRMELREAGDQVITYTELRKQSIKREIQRVSSTNNGGISSSSSSRREIEVHDSVIAAIFNAWLNERHASADRNLFPHAMSALQTIRQTHPTAIIGAITNGRGNPLHMPTIANYFDFCISGEDDGVFPRRKPDRGIYDAAITKFMEMQGLSEKEVDISWIHVGDDLANDVGASAACGAKSIWFTMEEEEEDKELPSWSTATKEELQRRAKMDEMAREHVSAKIDSLEELPGAIMQVLSG
mmetsp:Transcript_8503/g.18387  ORF Transcript_8503/g.18387 Transcript_8503/m.18387 type:complete len:362 (-) Transcript_8503:28-1113(-)